MKILCTYKIAVIILLLFFSNSIFATDYTDLRDAGKRHLINGNFADAKFKFEGAEGFAVGSEISEIRALQRALQDSINHEYNTAYNLMDRNPEKAILLFERLYDHNGNTIHTGVNAQLGWCYGKKKMPIKERQLYEKGLKDNEELAAYYLARLMQKNHEKVSSDSILNLYKKAPNVRSSIDSIGCIYYRRGDYNTSYYWFRKSSSICSKYNRACMLLDKNFSKQINKEYKNENAIELLRSAASADDLSSASTENADALYYLGLLYYYAESGDLVTKNTAEGRKLVTKAKDLGHKEAKKIWYTL